MDGVDPMKDSIEDFWTKIDWEGGIVDAIEYGLKAVDYDLPAEMVDDYNDLCILYDDFDSERSEFYRKWFRQ
jgi:hypothetical protein